MKFTSVVNCLFYINESKSNPAKKAKVIEYSLSEEISSLYSVLRSRSQHILFGEKYVNT